VPAAAALIAACDGHDWDDPGKPRIDWADKAARDGLVSALVNDATRIVDGLRGGEYRNRRRAGAGVGAGWRHVSDPNPDRAG
jgi:hypothetical protein